tara:strand:- start:35 stop:1075 length:1041 start_codon:yes stop_codon:yes gene_type:complete
MNKVVVGGIIVVVIIAVAIFFFYSPSQPIEEPREEGVMTGLEIAEMSLNYIDSLRNPNGSYTYTSNCVPSECPFPPDLSFGTSHAWVNYAYLGLYQASNDNSYFNKAKNEIGLLHNVCKDDAITCAWILPQVNDYYKITNDQTTLNLITTTGEELLLENPSEDIMSLGIEIRELAILYDLTKNDKYLTESVNRLNQAENLFLSIGEILYSFNNIKFYSGSCFVELGRLELYKSTDDSKYLEDVITFIDNFNIGNYMKELRFQQNMQSCTEVLLQLNELTGDVKYKTQAAKAMQYVITNLWDSSISKKYYGNEAFLIGTNGVNTITDTAYAIFSLTKLSNQKFEVGT